MNLIDKYLGEKKKLPPHIKALMKKADKRDKKFKAKVTDRTPKGYGPNEALKFNKDARYEFDHPTDATTMNVNWDERRKTWYGENGRFDFEVKTIKDLKAKLKKWGYKLSPNHIGTLYR